MRTSELAGRAGVNPETLRHDERRGLLEEPPRSAGGFRDHPTIAVEVPRSIERAQELGFTLDEVEELLILNQGGPDGCDAARSSTEVRYADLQVLIGTCDLPPADRRHPLLDAIDGDRGGR
ncbi:MerR family DNA-binding transcriptional regulator [Actinomycetes bacterium KLBMP 9759]